MKQLTVILYNIRSTYNVGAILRTCDCLGVSEVIFTGYTPFIDKGLPHEQEKLRMKFGAEDEDEEIDDDEDFEVKDDYKNHDDEDDAMEDPDDDQITENNYSTMMDLGSEDPDDEAAQLSDYVDE